jgi:hypothetical protein
VRRYNLNEPQFTDDETDPDGFKTASGAVVYPDSDKILINPKDRRDRIMVKRSSGVDYWEGER